MVSVSRPSSIQKMPQSWIEKLEDKQLDWLGEHYVHAWQMYQTRRFWPLFWAIAFSWLGFPLPLWFRRRRRWKEYQEVLKLQNKLQELRQHRTQRAWWRRLWKSKNQIRSQAFAEITRFYEILINAARQYNSRVDLMDYVLDRQNKGLEEPFKVSELEQIALTFEQVYDQVQSAKRLLHIAESNPDVDLASLLREGDLASKSSSYVSQTLEVGESGKFIQDLLVVESSLHQELAELAHYE